MFTLLVYLRADSTTKTRKVEHMGMISFTSTAKIRQNSILVYKRCDNPPAKSEKEKEELKEKAKENLLQNQDSYQYNGEPGKCATKKLRTIIDNWYCTLKYQYVKGSKKKIKEKDRKRLTFVTLTLAASQEHSDNQIKRSLLDNFILTLKRKFRVKNYVWRAELQKNGNIHFHFVLDTYIHYLRLRKIWNNIQEKLNYVSRFEQKYGHRDPNSTDVRAVRTSTLVGVYISKYVTKREKKRKKNTARSRMSRFNSLKNKLNYRFTCKKVEIDKGIKRVLQGRVWAQVKN